MKKYATADSNGILPPVLPPIQPKARETEKVAQKKNGAAYQVIFDDNDKMRTRKPTATIPMSKLPAQMMKKDNSNDLR